MMKLQTKKIIAREGLTIIAFVVIEILLLGLAFPLKSGWLFIVGYYVIPILYPVYLSIRFVIWAVKTLTAK